MNSINEIIRICREVLNEETSLDESVIREILHEALEARSEM